MKGIDAEHIIVPVTEKRNADYTVESRHCSGCGAVLDTYSYHDDDDTHTVLDCIQFLATALRAREGQ